MATLIGDGSHANDIYWCDRLDYRIVPHHTQYDKEADRFDYVIIGVNDPQLRARIADELDVNDVSWIHPLAHVMNDCRIGMGTHVNYAVHMVRTVVGKHCTISPGVTIAGDVTIGDRVLIGAGAVICDRVTIEDDVTIGAGAVVLPTAIVRTGETWIGVPAHAL